MVTTVNDIFWLARYAANKINETVAPIRNTGLRIRPTVEITFNSERGGEPNYLDIFIHQKNSLAIAHKFWCVNQSDVDEVITQLHKRVQEIINKKEVS